MSKIATAERVSSDALDNFVYARSLLAYVAAAKVVKGELLEIGTGSGYGAEILAQSTESYTTVDKHTPSEQVLKIDGVNFVEATVPPLPFEDESFDTVLSFQVIEHIEDDGAFVKEVSRVLRPGGRFILSTPNAPASLTRNPWHVREYSAEELKALVGAYFELEECCGVFGNEKVRAYYNKNRESVNAITRWDILKLQYRLPRWMLQIPYDILNRLNRKCLLAKNRELTSSIEMNDYFIAPLDKNSDNIEPNAKRDFVELKENGNGNVTPAVAFDLFYILKRK